MAKRSRKPNNPAKPKWLSYEQLAQKLLNDVASEFDLQSVQGKQKVKAFESGAYPTIDAKGITKDGKGFFVVETKYRGRGDPLRRLPLIGARCTKPVYVTSHGPGPHSAPD
jgi:hypothetical protein